MSDLSPARWAYIKALRPGPGRMFHKSCDAGMAPNPISPMLPAKPWVSKGETYNVGRNKAKRERRAALKAMRPQPPVRGAFGRN